MQASSESWVPKVHPLEREMFPEDPMELMANAAMGDPGYMLQCMVEEYLWMGWPPEQLFGLFEDPQYPMLQDLLQRFGSEQVRRAIDELDRQMGGIRVTAIVDETPDPDLIEEDDDMGLIQLSLRRREILGEPLS